jgi:hypothetical protein
MFLGLKPPEGSSCLRWNARSVHDFTEIICRIGLIYKLDKTTMAASVHKKGPTQIVLMTAPY